MTQEVTVPVAGLPRVLGRSVREPRGADRGEDGGGAAGQARDSVTGSRGDPAGDNSPTVVLEIDE